MIEQAAGLAQVLEKIDRGDARKMRAADVALGIFVQEVAEHDGSGPENVGTHHEHHASVLADDVEQLGHFARRSPRACECPGSPIPSGRGLPRRCPAHRAPAAFRRRETIRPGDDGPGDFPDVGAGFSTADNGGIDVVFVHDPEEFFSAEISWKGDVGVGVDDFHEFKKASVHPATHKSDSLAHFYDGCAGDECPKAPENLFACFHGGDVHVGADDGLFRPASAMTCHEGR